MTVKCLNDIEKGFVYEAYQQGMVLEDIASNFKVSRRTIKRVIDELNEELRQAIKNTQGSKNLSRT